MENKCENCKHWMEYKPLGGYLPAMYRGSGSCYPDGVKNDKHGIYRYNNTCTIGRFEPKEIKCKPKNARD